MNYTELIDYVRSLHESFQYFHLTKCGGCGGPSFQQPCVICRYYPMGDDPKERARCAEYKTFAKQDFLRSVSQFPNIVCWYIGTGIMKSCLFIRSQWDQPLKEDEIDLKYKIKKIYEEQSKLDIFPSAEQIWIWVVEENKYEEYCKEKYGMNI